MKNQTLRPAILILAVLILEACQPSPNEELKTALTFFVSFDDGVDAVYANGDPSMYTATSRSTLDAAKKGLHNADHEILKDQGKFGDAFRFGSRTDTAIFFQGKDNIVYDSQAWSGSISFWLSLDPAVDLEPGYTDPIQITDSKWNDAAIWVDFTRENPRDFRLGAIGDMAAWSKDTVNSSIEAQQERRMVRVKNPPFTSSAWTHIGITFESLGRNGGVSTLYVDGKKIGIIRGVNEPFTWEYDNAKIYLGLGFIGSMDEFAIFKRPLTAEEMLSIYQLEGGLQSIL